jgi:hypothetical protein
MTIMPSSSRLRFSLFFTVRIDRLCQHECIRGGEIRVCRGHGQDEAGVLADELHDHFADLSLDVDRLVAHWNLGEAGKIDQSDAQHCRF